MSSSGDRFTTPTNRGPLVGMTIAVALVWSILVFSIRMFIRLRIVPPLGWDDTANAIALFLAAGQAAATLTSIHYGLGRPRSTLNDGEISAYLKASYAAYALYILSIAASKMSTSLLIARLTRTGRHLIASYSTTAFTAAWAVASAIAVCVPEWDALSEFYENRSNRFLRWTVIESISMAIEVIIFMLSIYLVWSLYMPLKTKAVVVGAFFCRILIIIPTVFRLRTLETALDNPDITFSVVNPTILMQVVLHFSFVAATLPCMKQFLRAWNTDLGHTVNITGHVKNYGSGSGGSRPSQSESKAAQSVDGNVNVAYAMDNLNRDRGLRYRTPESLRQSQDYDDNNKPLKLRPDKVLSTSEIEVGPADTEGRSLAESDASDKAIIRMTTAWDISYKNVDDVINPARM